jgi:hypothetical protein
VAAGGSPVRVLRDVQLLIRLLRFAIPALIAAVTSAPVAAQTVSASPLDAGPPEEIATALRTLLTDRGVRVTAGDATIDFWWVKALPAPAGGAFAWSSVAEGTLVGAARVTGKHRDVRGRTIREGVYTLRFGLQPQNGDHLGTSPYREFLLVIQASSDTDPQPLAHETAVELSGISIKSSHPAVLSLDPPVATGEPLSVVTNDAGHQAVIFEVGVASGGKTRFGLIMAGTIEA